MCMFALSYALKNQISLSEATEILNLPNDYRFTNIRQEDLPSFANIITRNNNMNSMSASLKNLTIWVLISGMMILGAAKIF